LLTKRQGFGSASFFMRSNQTYQQVSVIITEPRFVGGITVAGTNFICIVSLVLN